MGRGGIVLLLAVLAIGLARSPDVAADERIAYLIETLEESLNYRVRVQTLQSLEQIAVTASGTDLTQIVTAIRGSLGDTNALVRYTAASTLVGLGRSALRSTDLPGVIDALRALSEDADTDVRQVVSTGLPALQARSDQLQAAVSGGSSGGGSGATAASAGPARFYVAVGDLGDSSESGRSDVPVLAKQYLVDQLAGVSGVEPHGEIPESSAFRRELRRRNLVGFVLQGSVVELRRDVSAVAAVISLLVLDDEQNLRVMLRGNGNAARRSGSLSDAELPGVQDDALRAAVQAAVASLGGYLRGL
jgi:hypothetical protein